MKLNFQPINDTVVRFYCINCQQETTTKLDGDRYHCAACGEIHPRAIIIDPQVKWSIGPTGEYVHETAGVIVVDGGKLLLFNRNRFPFGLTFPAGHVDMDEPPLAAAKRELREETGLLVDSEELQHVGDDRLVGDGCRRGSDEHIWHSFIVRKPAHQSVTITADEGSDAMWLTREQALSSNLTFATRQVLTRHWHRLALL